MLQLFRVLVSWRHIWGQVGMMEMFVRIQIFRQLFFTMVPHGYENLGINIVKSREMFQSLSLAHEQNS